ncbi:hypothetical protein A3715_05320 [Oleiphilus sp. HI0009]|nr:hypothetical protein A3715_05320 [Oleiphilus sp. HI0009]KZZ59001.1 hypothetical protein A3762_06195 [Oleiphilus sp. HI0125]
MFVCHSFFRLRSVLLCLLFVLSNYSVAGQSAALNTFEGVYQSPLSASYSYLIDQELSLQLRDIQKLPEDKWTQGASEQRSFGFTNAQLWFKTRVKNGADKANNFILEIDYAQLDHVVFNARKQDGTELGLATGDRKHFAHRQVDDPGILFRFSLEPNEEIEIYTSVKTKGSMTVPMLIWEETHYFEQASKEQKVHFFYYGVLTIIAIINLAVFLRLGERLYLYYALAIASYLLFFASSRGYIHQHFLNDLPELNGRLFLASMPLLSIFSLLFAKLFLRMKSISPRFDKLLQAMIALELIHLCIILFADYSIAVRISVVGALLLFSVLAFAGPIAWYKGLRSGIYFTVAWIPLTVGFAITSGRTTGALPNTFWTEYAMQIGSGLEALILTLALADRLYREREKKISAQSKSLHIEQQRNYTQSLLTQTMSRDRVTNLLNRNHFENLLREQMDAAPNRRMMISMVHLTRISDITRTLGLASSETVLAQMAVFLNEKCRDMFGVISVEHMQGVGPDAAFQIANETFGVLIDLDKFEKNRQPFDDLLVELASPIEFDGLTFELAPLYGCSLYPNHGSEPAQLIRNGLIAMDRSERGSMGIYSEKYDIYSSSRLTLMTDLRKALNDDALSLVFQPKFEISSGKVIGLEALVRWIHLENGFVPPDQFIPLAEETGVINELSLWVFQEAIRALVMLRAQGYDGSMSINISARDLKFKYFGAQLLKTLKTENVSPELVYLELTETAAMDDPAFSIATLDKLAAHGFKISIDDFGAGYSSLSYLKGLPASEIKLDRSLIEDIKNDENSKVIIQTVIAMAEGLGCDLIAEGIEDAQTLKVLEKLSCNRYQGYYGCKPLPLDRLQRWLEQAGAISSS